MEKSTLYTKIDSNVKDRIYVYVNESKLRGKKETDTIAKFVETAVDEYIRLNPN